MDPLDRSRPKRIKTPVQWGLLAILLWLVPLGGCQSAQQPTKPAFLGQADSVQGVDPARTPFHGWKPVDKAVARAALEMLIIARPTETQGMDTRVYTLTSVRGAPGELLVRREGVGLGIGPSDGLTIECRLGRRGEPELQRELLARVQASLIEQRRTEHE